MDYNLANILFNGNFAQATYINLKLKKVLKQKYPRFIIHIRTPCNARFILINLKFHFPLK